MTPVRPAYRYVRARLPLVAAQERAHDPVEHAVKFARLPSSSSSWCTGVVASSRWLSQGVSTSAIASEISIPVLALIGIGLM